MTSELSFLYHKADQCIAMKHLILVSWARTEVGAIGGIWLPGALSEVTCPGKLQDLKYLIDKESDNCLTGVVW